jgi:hypothetical protein
MSTAMTRIVGTMKRARMAISNAANGLTVETAGAAGEGVGQPDVNEMAPWARPEDVRRKYQTSLAGESRELADHVQTLGKTRRPRTEERVDEPEEKVDEAGEQHYWGPAAPTFPIYTGLAPLGREETTEDSIRPPDM